MAKNSKTQKAAALPVVDPNVYQMGNAKIELKKYIEVQGERVECELTHTFLQMPALQAIAQVESQGPQAIANVIRQSVYVPRTLPPSLENENGVLMLGRPLPKFEILGELVAKVQGLNPSKAMREGNSHHVLLPNGLQLSIGSIMLLAHGVGQNHLSPNGGNAGSYHPKLALDNFYKAGYRAIVDTKSALYWQIAAKFAQRESELKAMAEAIRNAPKPKSKKSSKK